MKRTLIFIAIAGIFFSCQREEEASSFTSDTTISVLPNTKAEVSTNNDAFLGLVAFTGKTDISAEKEPSNTYKGSKGNYQYDIKIMINIQ